MRTALVGFVLALAIPSLSLATSTCDGIAGNLISNCGFETGTFADWNQSGDLEGTGVGSSVAGYLPNSGSYFAELGTVYGDGYLTQTFQTTPGVTYDISWYVASNGTSPNDFSAWWCNSPELTCVAATAAVPDPTEPVAADAITLFSQTDLPATDPTPYPDGAPYPYVLYSYTQTATSTSSTLTFGFLDVPTDLALDDVSVVPEVVTPEPDFFLPVTAAIAGFVLLAKRRRARA
jgi:hypothetical protein